MRKISYIKELDGIRAIAAWMVMFLHFFQMLNINTGIFFYINKVAIFGGTGVSLFFVLSGFLITRILISSKLKKNYFKNFYIRRSLRIFPLYFLFLLFYYVAYPLVLNEKFVSFHNQIYYWVYLQNFALTFNWTSVGPLHLWSLAVEEHFYLIWPLLVYLLDIKWLKKSSV